jgi:hypothetical protein
VNMGFMVVIYSGAAIVVIIVPFISGLLNIPISDMDYIKILIMFGTFLICSAIYSGKEN